MLVVGVDILDDGKNIFVLEMNIWPDIFDTAAASKQDIFGMIALKFKESLEEREQGKTLV